MLLAKLVRRTHTTSKQPHQAEAGAGLGFAMPSRGQYERSLYEFEDGFGGANLMFDSFNWKCKHAF